jgi:phosphoribosyl-AMP cyclohydrolase / phosphoribosyl-ATP pyrophosphohydrolase
MRDRNAPLTADDIATLAWAKMDGLLPAIVQDADTREPLMLAYMDEAALRATLASGRATFFSRSKGRLWEKGETSGNFLELRRIRADCDGDALLVEAVPAGPVCHLGTPGCFGEEEAAGVGWLAVLRRIVAERAQADPATSYTARMLGEGVERIAQKIGEEGVELALAAVARDPQGCVEEAADLLYHLTLLMEARGFGWEEISAELRRRHGG